MTNYLSPAISCQQAADGDPDKETYSIHSVVEGRSISITNDLSHQPRQLRSLALQANIKYENELDFTVVTLDQLGTAAGVFTRNRSASPAVCIDREHIKDGIAQALVVISKNANVFSPTAYEDTMAIVEGVAKTLKIDPKNVLISCTGVIGVPLPMKNVRQAIAQIPDQLQPGLIDDVATAIMTTDTGPKTASIKFGDVMLAGMAKGAGMIEPNMATMLVYFFTNLKLDAHELQACLKRACDSTFNSISVDSDTSTSDSVMIFSTNEIEATEAHRQDFEAALGLLCLKLGKDIVYQGEGATKLIEVQVNKARNEKHAKAIAKMVVNSPLVKTAIFGADPNWGRVVMAIGKPFADDEPGYDPEKISISIGGMKLYHYGKPVEFNLEQLSAEIKSRKSVEIIVELGEGDGKWTVWGCDLSYKYVEINAEYTT